VGKTRVAAAIARSLAAEERCVGIVKPVATGVPEGDELGEDGRRLMAAVAGSWALPIPPRWIVPLALAEPLAPTVASRLRGNPLEPVEVEGALDAALAWWFERADVVLVEGIGGLLTPVAKGTTVADLAVRLDYPLVVVARRGLGTLNHTLLTVEAAQRRGLRVAGLVLNSTAPAAGDEALAEATNAGELARLLEGIAVLAEIPFVAEGGGADPFEILSELDWYGRALLPRWTPTAAPSGEDRSELLHAGS
jgi:dethiobiotin synthetase